MNIETLKYPIGQPSIPENISEKDIFNWIAILEEFPKSLEELVKNLSEEQLNTTYRPNGWTIKQVIHHCYDSHHNSYNRFKWALTENTPTIKPYYEERWAALKDSKEAPISLSINSLRTLHAKWVYLLNTLNFKELEKSFYHPTDKKEISLKESIAIYAWHCNHHFAHIKELLKRKNWL